MTSIERALLRIETDLRQLGVGSALIGGLAVSVRAEPRTTRDIDLAVAVESDAAAERLVRALLDRGYRVDKQVEHERTGRLATVRLLPPDESTRGVVVDLLFASSGIEPEVVRTAEVLEVLPGVDAYVATVPHLLALKILAGRPQDLLDASQLLQGIDEIGLKVTRDLLELISRRGFDRGKELLDELDRLRGSVGSGGPS